MRSPLSFPFPHTSPSRLHHVPKIRERNLAQRFSKWWVQSFLAGVATMVVGGRDDKGMLTEVSVDAVWKFVGVGYGRVGGQAERKSGAARKAGRNRRERLLTQMPLPCATLHMCA